MPFQDFRKGKDSLKSSTPREGASDCIGTLTAFIDQGSEFSGKLSFRDTVRIDGNFDGEITSENTLIVGESGMVQANICSEVVVVSGEVHGDIVANLQVTLHKTARVVGKLQTASLVIEEGAELNGHVVMSASSPAHKVENSAPAREKIVNLRENENSKD